MSDVVICFFENSWKSIKRCCEEGKRMEWFAPFISHNFILLSDTLPDLFQIVLNFMHFTYDLGYKFPVAPGIQEKYRLQNVKNVSQTESSPSSCLCNDRPFNLVQTNFQSANHWNENAAVICYKIVPLVFFLSRRDTLHVRVAPDD